MNSFSNNILEESSGKETTNKNNNNSCFSDELESKEVLEPNFEK